MRDISPISLVYRGEEHSRKVDLFSLLPGFRRRIREALEILRQSLKLNQDRGFELPAIYGNVLARDLFHPSSRDK